VSGARSAGLIIAPFRLVQWPADGSRICKTGRVSSNFEGEIFAMADKDHAPDKVPLDRERDVLEDLKTRNERLGQKVREDEDGGPGPKFHESGTIHPEEDDQSIAPPG